MRTSSLLVALLPVWIFACDGSGPPREWTGTVDTLSSGAVRVANPRRGLWSPGDAWRLEEEVRIGAVDGDGPALFGLIRDLEVDALGRVWVLEGQTLQVRVFDGQGRHVRTFGRSGDGPGEFRAPTILRRMPDGTMLVADPMATRLSIFDTAGTYVGAIRRELPRTFPWDGAVDPDGRILDRVNVRLGGTGPSHEVLIRYAPVNTASIRSESVVQPVLRDTFPVNLPEIMTLDVPVPGGVASYSVPFGGWLFTRLDGTHESFWTTNLRDYRLVRTGIAGDTTLIVEREFEPVPVTAEERDEAVRSYGGGGDVRIGPDDVPDNKPALLSFTIDADGFLWAEPTLPEGHAFDVFDPEGYYLGRVPSPVPLVNTPGRSPIRITRNTVWGVTRDSLDVEYLVRLRIIRS